MCKILSPIAAVIDLTLDMTGWLCPSKKVMEGLGKAISTLRSVKTLNWIFSKSQVNVVDDRVQMLIANPSNQDVSIGLLACLKVAD
jgi:hypothetical protein